MKYFLDPVNLEIILLFINGDRYESANQRITGYVNTLPLNWMFDELQDALYKQNVLLQLAIA